MPISNLFSTLNDLSITKNILKGGCSWQQPSIQVMSRHFSPSRTLGSLLMASCNLPPTILKNVSRKRYQYKVLICFICALFCRLSDDYERVPQKVHEFDAAHEKGCNTLHKNSDKTKKHRRDMHTVQSRGNVFAPFLIARYFCIFVKLKSSHFNVRQRLNADFKWWLHL